MRNPNFTLLLVALCACPSLGYALEAREIFKLAEPSVVVVLASDAKGDKNNFGSGVLIAPLEIATSCKVLEGATDFVVTQASTLRKARLRFQDRERDLCQLHIDDPLPAGKTAVVAATSAKLESGQDIFTVSSPRGMERVISRGMVSGLRESPGVQGRLIQMDAAAAGSRGGGVFDGNANLVGIITPQFRQTETESYAVPADWLAEMEKRNPDLMMAPPPAGTNPFSTQTTSQGSRPAWMPRTGDRWKYKLIDGRRPVGVIVVEVMDSSASKVRERITREGEKGFVATRQVDAGFDVRRFQDMVTLPGGFQFAEISPYKGTDVELQARKSWSSVSGVFLATHYGKRQILAEAKVIRQETVRVPAGEFTAWRIEAVSRNNWNGSNVKFTCNYWYAPELARTVKMSLEIEYQISVPKSTETYELVAYEPGP